MDELDRLFHGLMESVAAPVQADRRAPLTVGGLHRALHTPTAASPVSGAERERLMLRLLAGERGYVTTDRELQERAAAALLMPPATPWTALHAFADRPVALGGEGLRRAAQAATSQPPASVPPASAPPPSAPPAGPTAAGALAAAAGGGAGARMLAKAAAGTKGGAAGAGAAGAPPSAPVRPPRAPRKDGGDRRPAPCECHYCAHVLPRLRSLTFCPYCGQNLTVRHCPACSAEMDVDWLFCVACGRDVSPGGPTG